jgi:hypothetical protein
VEYNIGEEKLLNQQTRICCRFNIPPSFLATEEKGLGFSGGIRKRFTKYDDVFNLHNVC